MTARTDKTRAGAARKLLYSRHQLDPRMFRLHPMSKDNWAVHLGSLVSRVRTGIDAFVRDIESDAGVEQVVSANLTEVYGYYDAS